MAQAKKGDVVQVHYTGRLEDGTVFDSSDGREPLSFTLGEGNVIEGFEDAVLGMTPGDTTTTQIPAEQAYGAHRPDLVVQVQKDQISGGVEPEIGQQLQLHLQNGQQVPVVVTEVADGTVTIDANHPLAGKKLIFDIELVGIE